MRRSRLKIFLLYFAPQFSVYTKFGIDPLYQCGKTTVNKEVLCCLARSIDSFFIDAVQLGGTVALENKLYLAH